MRQHMAATAMTAALVSQMWKSRAERSDLLNQGGPACKLCGSSRGALSHWSLGSTAGRVASSGPRFSHGQMCTAQRWPFELLLPCTAPWASYRRWALFMVIHQAWQLPSETVPPRQCVLKLKLFSFRSSLSFTQSSEVREWLVGLHRTHHIMWVLEMNLRC